LSCSNSESQQTGAGGGFAGLGPDSQGLQMLEFSAILKSVGGLKLLERKECFMFCESL
jgi:hypothetical protein